ncbi:hypothetical protein QUA62_03445 [Microcoleus sp. MON1_C1]|uniref:hypothetical protein n=1 Tax=Microcoleus sp. MON1_C1 TaxID=2818827 RepID=UPI002FD609E4
MHQYATSAELQAAVDFGDAMSNPLHKTSILCGLHLINNFLRKTEFMHASLETRFLPRYLAAKSKIYQEKPG